MKDNIFRLSLKNWCVNGYIHVMKNILQILFVLGFAVISDAAAQDKLIVDGDFERNDLKIGKSYDKGAWSAFKHGKSDAGVVFVDGKGSKGSRCVEYSRTTEGSDNFHLDQVIPVERNTSYKLSAWVRSDGELNPLLSVLTMKWKVLAVVPAGSSKEWQRVSFLFNSAENDRVRFEWFPGSKGKLYEGFAGKSWLDDVMVEKLDPVPADIQRALDLQRAPKNGEIDIEKVVTAKTGNHLPLRPITARNGVLIYPDGSEVALWGVNFQTALSWEYNGRLKKSGVSLTSEALKEVTDRNLDEIKKMGANMIRMHLLPSDFTDSSGNLRDSVYLDILDYTIAACRKRGIYFYLTFVNEMHGDYFKDSFLAERDRREWITDPELVDKTAVYIKALLTHCNPYTNTEYYKETAIALFEISNEPGYVSYTELCSNPTFAGYRRTFDKWCEERGFNEFKNLHYNTFRYESVLAYINRMCAVVRDTGSTKPVGWNCNWPRMIERNQDVFHAVADSTADAVSFCFYPGQSDVKHPFWANPVDLSANNYLPFIDSNYREYMKLRWILGKQFAGKAKLVYEFETFYSQSSHLYPAMARLYRSLGVQAANMWTYSLTPSAEDLAKSHLLNLYCTPNKSASFVIAGKLFEETPRYTPFIADGRKSRVFDSCAVSFEHNVSVWQDDDIYMQSRPSNWKPFERNLNARHITACGSSPQVTYDGTGIYFVDILDDRVDITINPDHEFMQPHWDGAGIDRSKKVSKLDSSKLHRFILHHPGWQGKVHVFRVEDGKSLPVKTAGGRAVFDARPGQYIVKRVE